MEVFCYDMDMQTLSYSEASQKDIPVISEILKDATLRKVSYGDTVWGSTGWLDKEIQDSLNESKMYIIRQGEDVVGTVSLQWEDERSWGEQPPVACYLHRLAIKDRYKGQGMGAATVDWAEQQAANNDRHLLRLDCEESNVRLCAYYEKLGFVKVGSKPIPEYGDYVAALYESIIE